ncbi:hypothetical protein A2962_00900 [Candidatus Woesebacteria bacterium RIFCSPLOWO2_01_FULL_39_61]|uniref:Glycoside hydrolase family 5 domain-containing protein n=1 Tax=Candidatus Woesebacteria bacterium RIFCSPHIGHO2_02_FULL_39_13 TaxID=1802505 RepID=A0A1F7YWZ8_9BACT|nr:MAG: hypothetical protein A2692_03705 [Candidatus Woesebacteria bacterium RIFCSPHIGHO2_01_FULL_39_95]OGM31797.1 MAG: hypothetical protein A3D01_05515 [Candidatus Woesebacteria bacterium RIFCSPHIGHO2_02_FULL_39_13]OGM36471.1 MAG: hypothetical protein A3E13_02395 [Candidatus Woesebacteria bacterium RIFCSPHIGHO2_12_FULL_40_20]OGM68762.1 MAG: hypothetical protein A2962_00900 [Candidatus Woesebacteria bacterium RIFCSPLOWO2_01_FULL_39_61]
MKYKLSLLIQILILIAFLFLGNLKIVKAVENPLAKTNNLFGIHILNESDIKDAANLVNSSGGEWGYVTLVIRKDERDTTRWQKVFDELRRHKLIPIVRIATIQQDGGWEKPVLDETDGWVSFLNSLNWVIKNRYVIIGNEPNHAKEWGGEVKPEEYADYLSTLSRKLKEESGDFFVLPAGFDASTPNSDMGMSEATFLQQMVEYKKDIFSNIDGWTSHSYPNPNFSGSADAEGRGTLKTYEWELEYLKKLGLNKDLPVFITETGWAHNTEDVQNGYKATHTISSNLKWAFSEVWNDPKIVAITPFVLNYTTTPFDIFSWKKKNSDSFYDFYYEIQNIPKPKGQPLQITTGKLLFVFVPRILKTNNKDYGIGLFENSGQSIWDWDKFTQIKKEGETYEIKPFSILNNTEPGERSVVLYSKI